MHRSIKQHMVRNAKFTCFSKKKKRRKKHIQQQQQTQKTQKQNKTQKKPWGLQQKKSY